MKRDFEEVLAYYQKKLRGRPDEYIKNVALSAWNNLKIDRANRFISKKQEAMASRGIKHHTFKWIFETDLILKETNDKYKLNAKTKPIRYLIGNEKPKIIMFVIISKVLSSIIYKFIRFKKAFLKWQDRMNKELSEINKYKTNLF